MDTEPVGVLAERIAAQVSGWGPARWRVAPEGSSRTRGEVLFDLVQHLADLCADVEGRPRIPVPHLDNTYVLPDQLRVMAADLEYAAPDDVTVDKARAALRAAHSALFAP